MEARRLHGRVALVTGASSGIGEATALALASEGAKLAIIARRLDRLERLADRIRENGGVALPIQTDVATETQVSAAVDRVVDEFGRLDMLLAIAGVGVAAPFQGTTTSEYRQMFDVNVFGLLYSIAASLPIMKAQRDGHVVILSSGTGRYIHPSTVYSASKHAATAIAESLRREVCTDGIRVTSVEPGAVSTEFISQMRPDVRDAVEKRLGDMELLEAQDVAAGIIYAVTQPKRVNINILTLYPAQQAA